MRLFLTYTTMFSKLLGSSLLMAVVLFMTSFASREMTYGDPCSAIQATVKISKDQNQLVSAKTEVIGAKGAIRYFFSDSKGDLLSTDYQNDQVKGLKPGKYTCLIREEGGCRKLIEFEVK